MLILVFSFLILDDPKYILGIFLLILLIFDYLKITRLQNKIELVISALKKSSNEYRLLSWSRDKSQQVVKKLI